MKINKSVSFLINIPSWTEEDFTTIFHNSAVDIHRTVNHLAPFIAYSHADETYHLLLSRDAR